MATSNKPTQRNVSPAGGRAQAAPQKQPTSTTRQQTSRPAASEGKIVQRNQPTSLASNADLPKYLREQLGNREGMEKVGREDMVIPRLALAQSLSPQLKPTNAAYLPDLKIGDLFNTATGEIYGTSIELIPLFFFKNRIKFNPIESGGGIDCQSVNGLNGGRHNPDSCDSCQYSQFIDGAPDCDKFLNYMSIIYRPNQRLAIDQALVVSMKSTSIKVAKKWNALIRLSNLPMYAKVYRIESVEESKGQQSWSQFQVLPQEFVSQEFFKQAKEFFDALKDQDIHVDTTGMETEGDTEFDTTDARM